MIQEQARLLAAYHHVGSMRVPRWVKQEVYTYMERCARQEHANACADMYYDQNVPAFWPLGSRERDRLGE